MAEQVYSLSQSGGATVEFIYEDSTRKLKKVTCDGLGGGCKIHVKAWKTGGNTCEHTFTADGTWTIPVEIIFDLDAEGQLANVVVLAQWEHVH